MKRPRLAPPAPPLGIDFAASPAGARSSRVAGLALLLAGLAVASTVAIDIAGLRAQSEAGERKLAELRQRVAGHRAAPAGAAVAVTPEDLAAAWKIADALGQPWARLLADLEAASAPQVALVAVEADTRGSRTVRIQAEAARAEDAFAYLRRLGEAPSFSAVSMVAHEDLHVGSREVFAFTLALTWSGAK